MHETEKDSGTYPAKTNKIYPDIEMTKVNDAGLTGNKERSKLKNGSENMVQVKQNSSYKCEDIPKDGGCITKCPCYQKLHDKFCFKVFVFLLIFCLNVVDLLSDWLLYHDVATTEKGLVFGPPEDAIVWLILAFSVVGSMILPFEVVNLWWESFRKNPWVDSDLMSAISTWIEDVPQIIINVMIVACREEAISYFQLVKASVVIVGAIIRITVTLIKYCSKRAVCEFNNAGKVPKYRNRVAYRILIILGLIVALAGSVTIFMFTQSERNPYGSINFKVPHSVIIGKYDNEKYFNNVSIFFSHSLFDIEEYHLVPMPENEVNWVKMASINNVRRRYDDTIFLVKYDTTFQKIILSLQNSSGNLLSEDCFLFNRSTGMLNLQPNCKTFLPDGESADEFIFKFRYKEPELPNLIFGDLQFNILVKLNGTCHAPDTPILDNVVGRLSTRHSAAMRYFHTRPGVKDNKHVLDSREIGQFYQADNLIDISKVWRTGFATCKTTGRLAPHMDTSITIPCP